MDFTSNLLKAKRDKIHIEIRSQNRQNLFNQKRLKIIDPNEYIYEQQIQDDCNLQSFQELFISIKILLQNVYQENNHLMSLIITLRNKLFENSDDLNQRKTNMQVLFDSNILQALFQIVQDKNLLLMNTKLVYESTWLITNLTSTDQDQICYLLDQNLIHIFKQFFNYEDHKFRELALLAFSNLIADNDEQIVELFKEHQIISLACDSFFTFSQTQANNNYMNQLVENYSGQSSTNYDDIREIIPVIEKFLIECTSDDILNVQSLNSLHQAILKGDDAIEEIILIYHSLVDYVIQLFQQKTSQNKYDNITLITSKILADLVSGDDASQKQMIEYGVLPLIKTMIQNKNSDYRIRGLFSLGNLFASNDSDLIDHVVNQMDIIDILIQYSQDNSNFNVKKEALIALNNLLIMGQNDLAFSLLQRNIIVIISESMDHHNNMLKISLLKALIAILKLIYYKDEIKEIYLRQLENNNFEQKVQELINHNNKEISNQANDLYQLYSQITNDEFGLEY